MLYAADYQPRPWCSLRRYILSQHEILKYTVSLDLCTLNSEAAQVEFTVTSVLLCQTAEPSGVVSLEAQMIWVKKFCPCHVTAEEQKCSLSGMFDKVIHWQHQTFIIPVAFWKLKEKYNHILFGIVDVLMSLFIIIPINVLAV